MQPRGKILEIFPKFILYRKASLQIRTTKEVENPQQFSGIIARVIHHKKKASGQNNITDRTKQRQSKEYEICDNLW